MPLGEKGDGGTVAASVYTHDASQRDLGMLCLTCQGRITNKIILDPGALPTVALVIDICQENRDFVSPKLFAFRQNQLADFTPR